MTTATNTGWSFWRQFVPLWSAGAVGIAVGVPVSLRALLPHIPAASLPAPAVLIATSLAQSAVLLSVAAATGIALAPRLGLRSHLASWGDTGTAVLSALRPELPLAVGSGFAAGLALWAVDTATLPWMPARLQTLAQAETRGVLTTLTGMLYSGITEELLLRWCVMSLFAWCGWRFAQRSGERPRAPIMWAAITPSAHVFGLGYLPAATAIQVPLTDALVARTLALNGLAGVVSGTLFWRRSLEAGMVAHAMTHVALSATVWMKTRERSFKIRVCRKASAAMGLASDDTDSSIEKIAQTAAET